MVAVFLNIYCFLQLNNSLINKRIGSEDGHKHYEDYKWIIPFSYESNLEDFKENFVLNRTHCKYKVYLTWIFIKSLSSNEECLS